MSPPPSGSLAPQRIKLGDAFEIHDGIIFELYPGLPHMRLTMHKYNNTIVRHAVLNQKASGDEYLTVW